MEAKKYDKVEVLPDNAIKVSMYAQQIGQNNPPYICVMYDRYLANPTKAKKPPYKIVNWQGINFVIPE
jgi:hypothetical protein